MSIPENLQYTKEHEWLKVDDGIATVGITAFAAESLGDIVFVQLPEAGSTVTAGEVFGEVESTKSVSELYAPVSGEVVEGDGTTSGTPEIADSCSSNASNFAVSASSLATASATLAATASASAIPRTRCNASSASR